MGTLYWITGLPGAGKTTLGKLFFNFLKVKKSNTVFLDGDELREAFGQVDSHYSESERRQLAMKYAKLCKLLVDQDTNVVCATVSMFDEVRQWNRENIKNYKEIYLKADRDFLVKQDKKNLYSQGLNKNLKNVVGVDLAFDEPKSPDVVIRNEGLIPPDKMLEVLIRELGV